MIYLPLFLNEDLFVRVWRSPVLLRPDAVNEVLHLVNFHNSDSRLHFGQFVNFGNELWFSITFVNVTPPFCMVASHSPHCGKIEFQDFKRCLWWLKILKIVSFINLVSFDHNWCIMITCSAPIREGSAPASPEPKLAIHLERSGTWRHRCHSDSWQSLQTSFFWRSYNLDQWWGENSLLLPPSSSVSTGSQADRMLGWNTWELKI